MSGSAAIPRPKRTKAVVWLAVAIGLVIVLAANAHFLYVAAASQSGCVAHVQLGDAKSGRFSAAESACGPG